MITRSVGALFAALVASHAAGCIISDDTPHDVAHITATWQLKDVGSDVSQPCPVGYNSVALYAQPVDINGNAAGPPFVTFFPCNAGSGISGPLPPDVYQTWIEITNENNSGTYYAQSVAANLDVVTSDKTFNAAIYYNGGYFQVDWNLVDSVTGIPMLCSDDPDAAKVGILTSLSTPTNAYDDRYPCENYTAITPALIEGIYTVDVAVLDASGHPLGDSREFTHQVISGPNLVTQMPHDAGGNYIGPVTLPVDPPL